MHHHKAILECWQVAHSTVTHCALTGQGILVFIATLLYIGAVAVYTIAVIKK